MKSTAPKAKLGQIIKTSKKKLRLSKKAYSLLFLNYMMFLKRMAVESDLKVIESKQNTLTPQHLKDVKKQVLRGCRG